MSKAPTIDQLTAEHLLKPVSKMLGQTEIGIINWRVEPLRQGAGNPVTIGLYHISGSALAGTDVSDFGLVLKIIQSPDNVGIKMGGGDDEQHWNYWQREPLFYQSGLADLLPSGFNAPKFYGLDRWDGRIIWLWMEAINHCHEVNREVEDLAFLAQHLGRFNGLFTTPNILPPVSWLATNTHEQWLQPVAAFKNPIMYGRTPSWDHPHLKTLFPNTHSPFHRFWHKLDDYLALLDDLPPTWCHGDSDPNNFKVLETEGHKEAYALDWALTCVGVLGQEIGHLLYGSYFWFSPDDWPDLTKAILDSYLDGLQSVGWQGSTRQIRLGFAITILVKYTVFAFLNLGLLVNEAPDIPLPPQYHNIALFLEQTAEIALNNT